MSEEDTSRTATTGYTAEQLERETGFDRRTIAYYVQEGLLPKVGRRGPRTRYPQLVMDRLRFVRRVREAEALGELAPITLSGIRRIFEQCPPELVAQAARGEHPVQQLAASSRKVARVRPASARRATIERDVARRRETGSGEMDIGAGTKLRPMADAWIDSDADDWEPSDPETALELTEEASASAEDLAGTISSDELELSDALAELQARARHRRLESSEPYERWSSVELTPNISLLVRGATDEDTQLLDDVSRRLRELIRRRRQEPD